MRRLRVAFVGMRRAPSSLPNGYIEKFVKYHLELPFYYAKHSLCDVDLTTVEDAGYSEKFVGAGSIRTLTEKEFIDPDFDTVSAPYDVVVHWRRWFDDLYVPGARNVILSQDHSYNEQWKSEVAEAKRSGRLDGILVFPTWHKENTAAELDGIVKSADLYEGMTLGVDTDIYRPMEKDHFHMLWASDPGRGLDRLIHPFLRLWGRDRRYRLTVTYPDYVKPESVGRFSSFFGHPAVRHLPGLRNGPQLWDLFNTAGILPYSSNFMEPSSRCHRQAMAAGSVVLYPPGMGTPSRLIENGLTGIVEEPALWADIVLSLAANDRLREIGANARTYAVGESWPVQAARFYEFFSRSLK